MSKKVNRFTIGVLNLNFLFLFPLRHVMGNAQLKLQKAVVAFDSDAVEKALAAGASPTAIPPPEESGNQPKLNSLQFAVMSGFENGVRKMLQKMPEAKDVKTVDNLGLSLLHLAKTPEIVKLLCGPPYEIPANIPDNLGRTPLHSAALRGRGDATLKALIEAGASVLMKDRRGFTPLDRAVEGAVARGIQEQAEAALKAENADEKEATAADDAKKEGHNLKPDVLQWVSDAFAAVDRADSGFLSGPVDVFAALQASGLLANPTTAIKAVPSVPAENPDELCDKVELPPSWMLTEIQAELEAIDAYHRNGGRVDFSTFATFIERRLQNVEIAATLQAARVCEIMVRSVGQRERNTLQAFAFRYRQRIRSLYQVHSPEYLKENEQGKTKLQELFIQYRWQEAVLLELIIGRYGEGEKHADPVVVDDAPDPVYRARLIRFYEKYNPSKISSVDSTLLQFRGREESVFSQLVKKYGPEPDVQPSPGKRLGAYRPRLTSFYEKYNPGKLQGVDSTLEKWNGREDELFQQLVIKYGPEPPAETETVAAADEKGKEVETAPAVEKKETELAVPVEERKEAASTVSAEQEQEKETEPAVPMDRKNLSESPAPAEENIEAQAVVPVEKKETKSPTFVEETKTAEATVTPEDNMEGEPAVPVVEEKNESESPVPAAEIGTASSANATEPEVPCDKGEDGGNEEGENQQMDEGKKGKKGRKENIIRMAEPKLNLPPPGKYKKQPELKELIATGIPTSDGGAVSFLAYGGSLLQYYGDAIVNAANYGGTGGGGIDMMVNQAGGPQLVEARRKFHGIKLGEAKTTQSFGHKKYCKMIIHCAVPSAGPSQFNSQSEKDALLAKCYQSALLEAVSDEHPCVSVGFCLMAAGLFRGNRTFDEVIGIGVASLRSTVQQLSAAGKLGPLREIAIMGFKPDEQKALVSVMKKEFSSPGIAPPPPPPAPPGPSIAAVGREAPRPAYGGGDKGSAAAPSAGIMTYPQPPPMEPNIVLVDNGPQSGGGMSYVNPTFQVPGPASVYPGGPPAQDPPAHHGYQQPAEPPKPFDNYAPATYSNYPPGAPPPSYNAPAVAYNPGTNHPPPPGGYDQQNSPHAPPPPAPHPYNAAPSHQPGGTHNTFDRPAPLPPGPAMSQPAIHSAAQPTPQTDLKQIMVSSIRLPRRGDHVFFVSYGGSILSYRGDAVVNAAAFGTLTCTMPLTGTAICLDDMVNRAGGQRLCDARRKLPMLNYGEAASTPSFDHKLCKYFIHAVGPMFGGYGGGHQDSERLLIQTYHNALLRAVELQCASVAFCPLSAGVKSVGSSISLEKIIAMGVGALVDKVLKLDAAGQLGNLQEISFCGFKDEEQKALMSAQKQFIPR